MYVLLFSQTLFSSGITNILGYLLVKKQHPDSFGEKVCDEPWRANELSQRTFCFPFGITKVMGYLLVKNIHPFRNKIFLKNVCRYRFSCQQTENSLFLNS